METPDLIQTNIEKLAALFPACVTEARGEDGRLKKAVNFELLRQMLSDVVLEGDETYEFTWVGKKAAIVEANRPIRKNAPALPGGERGLGHHRKPLHRGRQPGSAQTVAGELSGQGEDDLHRPALQHRQRLHLSGRFCHERRGVQRRIRSGRRERRPPVSQYRQQWAVSLRLV